ncbi:sulfite exporter TauE/SafE family protein, partial [Gammaproteobacteria bacterium]|nr:sulfite exporter TauE/SafE family protein [Gammaproteobacteria bacterium]
MASYRLLRFYLLLPVNDLLLYLIPVICFMGAYLSTVAGMGGGLLILACCSQIMPITAVVPLNGVFVMAGQIARVSQFYKHTAWDITLPFIPGSILGVLLGTLIYFSLSEVALAFMLGCVMLWFCWVPSTAASKKIASTIPYPFFWVGIIHTFLSTVSGAGGLFQSLMVNSKLNRESIVATIAATLLAMSIFKTIGYLAAGFDYLAYLPIILLCW